MATVNGKTPEQMAKEIVQDAVKECLITVDGVTEQKIDDILKYRHAKDIYVKGQLWFQNNIDDLRREYVQDVVRANHVQRQKADAKAAQDEKLKYYTMLVSRGVEKAKALEMAGL